MALIECNHHKCFGMPSLIGRRLTVFDVVTKIYIEPTLQDALTDYEISAAQATAALSYCISLRCQKDKDRISFCDGCILRSIEEGERFNKDDYTEIDKNLTVSKDGLLTFLGSLQELEIEQFGRMTWEVASEVRLKYKI